MHLPHVLFPQLRELHTTCLHGLPIRGDYWLRSADGLRALTLTDEIRLFRKRIDDIRVIDVISNLLQSVNVTEDVRINVRVRLSCDTMWPLNPDVASRLYSQLLRLKRPNTLNFCLVGLCRRDSHRLSNTVLRARPRESVTVVCHTNLSMLRHLRQVLRDEKEVSSALELPRTITVDILQNEFNESWLKEFSSLLADLVQIGPRFTINVHNTHHAWDIEQLSDLRDILTPHRALLRYAFW